MASEATPLVVFPTNGEHHTAAAAASQKLLTTLLGSIQAVLLILFLTCTKISDEVFFSSSEYVIFRDIMVMLLLGFGFLMTFLAKYGLGAVGYVSKMGRKFCFVSSGLIHIVRTAFFFPAWKHLQIDHDGIRNRNRIERHGGIALPLHVRDGRHHRRYDNTVTDWTIHSD